MPSPQLDQFDQNLETAEGNLRDIRNGLDTINDVAKSISRAISAVEKISTAITDVIDVVETINVALKLASKVSPIATPAKALQKIVKQAETILQEQEEDVSKLFDKVKTLGDYLSKVNKGISVIELDLKVSELVLESTREDVGLVRLAVDKLETSDVLDGDPIDVTGINANLDQTVESGNLFLTGLIAATEGPADTINAILGILDPPDFDFDAIESISDSFSDIQDVLDVISIPLDALAIAVEPIQDILDAVDAVYDFLVAPVIDPILEATGIQALLDEVGEQITELLPDIDVLDPLNDMIEPFEQFVQALDFSLPDPAFAEALAEFIGTLPLTNGIIESSLGADHGLPFEYGTFSITPQNEEYWTRLNSGVSYNAEDEGTQGFVFGDDFGQTIIGGVGSDLIFGGGGDDILKNEAVGEDAGSFNFFIGGTGDDEITAFGRSLVYYLNGIGEYFITQGTETVGGVEREYADIEHLAQASNRDNDGLDRVYYDSETFISFGNFPIFNMEIFLRGYQAATPDNADLFGDRNEAGVPDSDPLRDFLIGNTSDFMGVDDQVNKLYGYKLDDFLSGGDGDDELYGGDDNDYLVGGRGVDLIDGGAGIDTASFVDLEEPIVVNNPGGARDPFGSNFTRGAQLYLDKTPEESNDLGLYLTDVLIDVENIVGSQFEEIVFGSRTKDNVILGEAGDDVLRGIGATSSGPGNLVDGGDGKDAIIIDSGKDMALGGDGDDVFYVAMQAQFLDAGNSIDGGEGNDLINYSAYEELKIFGLMNGRHAEVIFQNIDFGPGLELSETMLGGSITVNGSLDTIMRVHDATGAIAVDTYTNVEAIIGTAAGDTFISGESDIPVQFHGGGGNDEFFGLGWGIDSEGARDFSADGNALFGGDGDDNFELYGSHAVHGGAGFDTLDLSKSDGFWVVDSTGLDWFSGSQIPVLEHFSSRDDLPDVADLFVKFNQINNADPLPFWYDPSDENNPVSLPDFVAPLDEGQDITGIEVILGTDRRDVILGGRDVVEIHGNGGNDYLALRFDSNPQQISQNYPMQKIFGGDGDDLIVGHFGAEELHGGNGNDIIDLVANVFDDGSISRAFGGSGADLFHALDYDVDGQLGGLQEIYGGEETFDVVLQDGTVEQQEYQDAVDFGDGEVSLLNPIQSDGIWIDLSDSTNGFPGQQSFGISLFGIENVFGTRYNDDIFGDEFDNILIGRDGNDEIRGGGGNDIIVGGRGDDDLFGDEGDDIFIAGNGDDNPLNGSTEIFGGEGRDTVSFQFVQPDGRGSTTIDSQSMGHVVIQLDSGFANFVPDADNPLDSARTDLTSIENATGTRQDDGITGNDEENVLVGDAGDDFIRGRGGNDTIVVGIGDDEALGDEGDDVFFGASGENSFDGGIGNDRLDFSSNTFGLTFDLDAQTLSANYLYSVHVFADQADAGGTLAERAAYTKQTGSNDPGALGVRSITAEDIFKIENPLFADRYFQLEEGFVRSTIGADGKVLGSFAFVEQSEVRSYTNTLIDIENFVAGSGDDAFSYTNGSGFAGTLDGGAGADVLDLRGATQPFSFETTGAFYTVNFEAVNPGEVAHSLRFTNIEKVLTAGGDIDLNTDPTANDDVARTDKDTAITIEDVLENDADGNPGDVLSVASIDTTGTLGLVVNNGDGTFNYDPNGAFDGLEDGRIASDSFTYEVSDGNGGTDTARVVVTIRSPARAANVAPEAVDDDGISGTEDQVVVISPAMLLANDIGNGELNDVGDPVNGTVAINAAGDIEFTPDPDFNGQASFVYEIANASGQTSQATVTLILDAVNDAPTLINALDDQSSSEDQPISFTIPADTFADIDGDVLSLSAELADGSALPVWLAFDEQTRAFSGTPPLNFNGTLQVKVFTDDSTLSVFDIFDLMITPVNDAPDVATPLADQTSPEDEAVSFAIPSDAFADVDGDSLNYAAELADGSALPTWLDFDDQTLEFTGTPPLNFNGTLQVKVIADDGALSSFDIFDLEIALVNDAPVANDDAFEVAGNMSVVLRKSAILANDTDVDDTDLSIISLTQPGHGTVSLRANGSVKYKAEDGFIGTETFNYTVSDGELESEATITVEVLDPFANYAVQGTNGRDYLFGNWFRSNEINARGGNDVVVGGWKSDQLAGGKGSDFIYGWSGDDDIDGGAGNDWISGGRGNDRVNGSSGRDEIYGSDGDDEIMGGDGADYLSGGRHDDNIHGGWNNDKIVGGSGKDNLSGGHGDDKIYGGFDDDVIDGGGGKDRVSGGSGHDRIEGGSGRDHLEGDDGCDTISGGAGSDHISGGRGRDNINGDGGNDKIYGGSDSDHIDGGAGNDWISGESGHDHIIGGAGKDRLYGNEGRDTILGGVGADYISGGQDRDILDGGDHDDTIYGGSDDDVINGGAGNDQLFGDSGADIFQFSIGNDYIHGGRGFDIAEFDGDQSDFTIAGNRRGHWEVTENASGDVDILDSIAMLKFDDGDLFA